MGNSANGIYQDIKTTKRSRKILCGNFTTAAGNAPTSQVGDGVVTRTGTGAYAVTLSKTYGTCESVIAQLAAPATDQYASAAAYTASTGVIAITVQDIGTPGVADTTGLVVNWIAVLSDRSS